MEKVPKNINFFIQQAEPPTKLMQLVRQADEMELQQVVTAIMRRYAELFPDWEVTYFAIPHDPVQREIVLESAFRLLRECHK